MRIVLFIQSCWSEVMEYTLSTFIHSNDTFFHHCFHHSWYRGNTPLHALSPKTKVDRTDVKCSERVS